MSLIPVTVLTGFLGAGKSTALNALLHHPGLADTAVIVNELGDVGLDHLLVETSSEDVVVLNAGCLCCTLRGDLVRALGDLYARMVRDQIPEFRRVVIETTGLADPAPLLHTLMTDPLISARYRLDGVVTVIDAVHAMGQLDRHPEAVKQAAVADRLVLTKTDLSPDPQALDALKTRLRALNPAAPQLVATHGVLDPALVLDCGLFSVTGKAPDVARWLNAEAYADTSHAHDHGHDGHGHGHGHGHNHGHGHDPDHGHPHHGHGHGHHHHGDGDGGDHALSRHDDHIRAYALSFDAPLAWDAVVMALDMLIASRGDDLLRFKGILDVAGRDQPIAVHGVQHIFHPPTPLPAWPVGQPRRSHLVFITRGIERETVESLLDAVLTEDDDVLR
ncbi:CobW family GTP-binding protein [Pararhodospirillum oryzae]|uniref:ATP-binding protein n=1 Tax=Pararhodospirillum oryzae TaxID=478448 RepID=A0A512H4F7_9PROT|nr:GTP-binding protein [Pararhodospirillum oryzae]GEO80260.1 ATP-binding protein [Pararhodospirillum oryzae]